jgi:hypothetical protein
MMKAARADIRTSAYRGFQAVNGPESGSLPPVVPLPAAADPDPDHSDRRDGSVVVLLADLAVGLGLLAALAVVFLWDRAPSGTSAAFRHKYENYSTIFDPLQRPVAELREYPQREKWIGTFGGSDKSEEAVLLGLQWLARHQMTDGHWGPDCLHMAPAGCCREAGPCGGAGSEHRLAQTALAILAMQAAGHYDFNGNEYSANVRRGLEWLISQQQADGGFVDTNRGLRQCNMYEHGIASFALADACEMAASLDREPDDRLRQAAQRAVQFIEYAQHTDGGWRYTPEHDLPSDTSVSGWQVLALKAAKRAKIVEVDNECVEQVLNFFRSCEMISGKTGYQPRHALSDATTGVGMLVHEFILEQPDSPLVKQGAEYLAQEAENNWKTPAGNRRRAFAAANHDFYTWYNCTLAMFQAGGEPWKRWNNIIRDQVIALQCRDHDACTCGSWDPLGRWAPQGGRVYSTALAVLTLEVYYRYKSQRANVYKP